MMLSSFPLFPTEASSFARDVDTLYIFMVVVTGAVSIAVFLLIFFFAIKYRRTPTNELAQEYEPPKALEIGWIVVPFIIFMFMFGWG